MNLVLDAFERVGLYPSAQGSGATGASIGGGTRRRASTSGLVTTLNVGLGDNSGGIGGASGPIVGGTQSSAFSSPFLPGQRQNLLAHRRRSGQLNLHHNIGVIGTVSAGIGLGSIGHHHVGIGRANKEFMAICQSNSLTGLNRHQQQQKQVEANAQNNQSRHGSQHLEIHPELVAMQQSGGMQHVSTTRSRSTAVGGRRKKSMFHVQRKQSVASLLFSALASPTSSDSGSRIRRRQSRAAGPPPRQWSVPERPSIERRPSAEGEDEEEPFCLIQKTNSMALSSPGGRSPPARQLSAEDPQQISPRSSVMGSPLPPPINSTTSGHVLLGFVPPPTPPPPGTFRPVNGRRLSETACLSDWIRLRAESGVEQAMWLRCVDPEPAFPFLQFANLSDQEQTIRLAEEMAQTGHAQFGCFEELFALERAKTGGGFRGSQGTIGQQDEQGSSHQQQQQIRSGCVSPCPDGNSSSSLSAGHQQHRGFILVCFRLLDEEGDGSPGSATTGSSELESSWLTWTGAGQIYKYSPRAWALCRLSLLRRVHCPPGTAAPFAYVLLCEFGAILHPTNALAALDMCERLRARNCGLVALYQVRQSFSPSSGTLGQSVQSLGGVPSSLSPHWSPHQMRRQQLARMGRSQDERGRQGGGAALLRMIHAREGSLGWDQPQSAQNHANSAQQQHWRGEPGIGTSL